MKYKDTVFGKIPSEWEVDSIKNVTSIVTDYVANGSFASLAENVEYLSTKTNNVLIRLVDYNNDFKGPFVYIDDKAYEFLSKSKLVGGEIIISNVGANVGTVFRCPFLKCKMSLAPNSIVVKFKENNDFYFHWLKSTMGQFMLHSIVTGSAQPKFNKTNFRDMLVPVPPIQVQNKIANIFNSIDKKIELNNKINDNLYNLIKCQINELMSYDAEEGLFGWKQYKLTDLCKCYNGYSYKGIELQENNNLALVTIKNFVRNGGFKLDGFKELIPAKEIKEVKYLNLFDVVVACTDLTQNAEVIGNGEIILSKGKYDRLIMSMDLVKLEPKNNVSRFLIAGIVSSDSFKQHCLGYVNGSTVLHLNKNAFDDFKILLPEDINLLDEEVKLIEKEYRQISCLLDQNQRLEELRDTLLPKLMSGEIDVESLDI